ncbi:TNT domain-containing protein [Actinokineospora iranica]|uniref:TNT domain-containing protein n=1 Tax=Actinokineospora iranica TaxID=1271860 RepID=A0A1G6XP86_9PSEU|nr:TNT domain-containing protein [Actinokineospora iranica]SDD79970.1 Protein of unknown function [Actinokineospora iranica]
MTSWPIRSLLAVVGAVALLAPTTVTAQAQPSAGRLTECSQTHTLDDPRFGPRVLPKRGVVGEQLVGYRRTGKLTPRRFLETYYDSAANGGQGSWRYPPADGYLLSPEGTPVIIPTRLAPGRLLDRYGSEYGQFLAPKGSSYASRSIPPQSLVSTPAAYCNYRAYEVLRPFVVDSGPIAPWFAQPGGGWQYQLKAAHIPGAPSPLNVKWLLDNGFLKRIIGPPQTRAERDLPTFDRALSFG